jgi:hypothetical protein
MTTAKPGLPICQHIFLGLQLLHTREQLLDTAVKLGNAYPKAAGQVRQARKAQDAVDELRNRLDSVSSDENPAGDWSPAIYYGADREVWEREVLPIWRRHQADNPGCCAGIPEPRRGLARGGAVTA